MDIDINPSQAMFLGAVEHVVEVMLPQLLTSE